MNAADAGDTIKVRPGVYKEAVRIDGRKKRYLKLIGDPRRPARVVLDGSGKKQNGIAVNNAARGDGQRLQGPQLPRQRVLLHRTSTATR